jgi:hypothetical protein
MHNEIQFYVEDTGHDDAELIALVAESWEVNGWTVNYRTKEHAQENPFYEAVHANMADLTSGFGKGPRAEVMYNRWLGHCPGWMADYDIVNMSFTPEHAHALTETHEDPSKLLLIGAPFQVGRRTLYPPTPAFLTEESLRRVLEKFASYRGTRKDLAQVYYIDDQNLIGALWRKELVEHHSICTVFRESGWETAPLIHFTSWSIDRSRWGQNRISAVKKALGRG